MRYLFLHSVFLLGLLSITSCGNDDDALVVDEVEIVGNWRATSYTQVGTVSSSFGGQTREEEFSSELILPTDYGVVFTANPNKVINVGTASIESTTILDGLPTTTITTIPSPVESGDWEIEDNVLRITAPGQDPTVADIVTLNENTLKLSGRAVSTRNLGGAEVTYDSDFTYSFERR
jgi:hypothetical protein